VNLKSIKNQIPFFTLLIATVNAASQKIILIRSYAQQVSLFSQLQRLGSFKQDGHMIMPHPTQVLLSLLQPQCLQSPISFAISM
jgi:hypothetical protein